MRISAVMTVVAIALLGGNASATLMTASMFELGGPTTPGGAGELKFAPDVSNSDLLDGITGSQSGSWGAPASRLNDGDHGGSFDQGAGITGIAWPTIGASVTFTLGLGDNGLGFDITEIQSIAAWQSAGFGNQAYTIELKPVGGGFAPLTSVLYTPIPDAALAAGAGATKVNLTDDTGIIATGIEAIRFTQNSTGQTTGSGRTTYRELDVFGTSTSEPIPEPSTLALVVLGGLLVFGRYRGK